MGQKGKEISKLDHKWLLNELNKAYAFEWVVHYYASLAANIVSGLATPVYAEIFKKASEGELEHANRIAKRIAELGGEPPAAMAEIEKLAGFGKIKFPAKRSDTSGFAKVFLEMERHAIALYDNLAQKTHGKDLVTHELAEDLLSEEVAEEEEYENLLRE
ncbi:bacterioferritin [Candidatus Woesearchaeota archaeon]|nr:bacterioferritin [Candidatus Woesearchaeota archaeon]